MILTSNRSPLLCYFKLCASFRSHRWIQTQVTVRRRPICPTWPWNFTDDLEKQKGTKLHVPHEAPCIISSPYVKGCVSLDPSKISKSGWWGLQLDTWQLCNSLWYGLINSKLHINKIKQFFISHNIRRCHTSNVLNHPADLSGMDLTSDPSWFTHSPGKASTKRYSPQIFKGSLLFSLSTANKKKQILCVICFDTKWLSVLFKAVII